MLSGEGKENGQKTTIGLISKKGTLHVQHIFFFCTFRCRCFARLQRGTSRNFLVTRFMEEMSYMFLFTIFFFNAAHFPLGGRKQFSVSHRRYNIFMLFQQKTSLFFFTLAVAVCRSLSR